MQLITDDVWEYISKCAKQNKNRCVAVAYLGTNASKYLRLGSGDVLVVDASENSIRSGNTNPLEIAQYLKDGVHVYSYENLHAKVFVFGNVALVGSANVSGNAAKVLTECMVEIKNLATVSAARGFVRSLALEPLSPEYVKHLIEIYLPPKFNAQKKSKSAENLLGTCLWIQEIHDYEYTETEQAAHDRGEKKAVKLLTDAKYYQVDSLRYKNKSTLSKKARVGDMIVRVLNDNVYPPSRIFGFERSKEDQSTIVIIEEPVNPRIIKVSRFILALKKNQINKVFRAFSKAGQKNIIFGLWTSFHKST